MPLCSSSSPNTSPFVGRSRLPWLLLWLGAAAVTPLLLLLAAPRASATTTTTGRLRLVLLVKAHGPAAVAARTCCWAFPRAQRGLSSSRHGRGWGTAAAGLVLGARSSSSDGGSRTGTGKAEAEQQQQQQQQAVAWSSPATDVKGGQRRRGSAGGPSAGLMSSSSGSEGEGGLVLGYSADPYDGVIVDTDRLPEDPREFESRLSASLAAWRLEGKRGVWLKVPLSRVALVPVAADQGFVFHHAEPQHVMMTHWLVQDVASTLPPGPSHQVGVGAIVLDGCGGILAVQERAGPLRGLGVWKMPTGLLDAGEDLGAGAVREVLEETGVQCEFESVLAFRHAHAFAFSKSDLFFVTRLRPLSKEVSACPREIEACAWVPVTEFFAQPRFQSSPLYRHVYRLCLDHALGKPMGPSPLVARSLPMGFKPGHGTVYHAPPPNHQEEEESSNNHNQEEAALKTVVEEEEGAAAAARGN